jgi:hypothetical protein
MRYAGRCRLVSELRRFYGSNFVGASDNLFEHAFLPLWNQKVLHSKPHGSNRKFSFVPLFQIDSSVS